MPRPPIEERALATLRANQTKATCDQWRYAALIMRDGRILVEAFADSTRGLPPCDEVDHDIRETWMRDESLESMNYTFELDQEIAEELKQFYEENGIPIFCSPTRKGRYSVGLPTMIHKQNCIRSIHAEQNAIAWAAREGIAVKGGSMYSTMFPCQPCAKLIVQAGIVRVIAEYDHDSSGPSKFLFDDAEVGYEVVMDDQAYDA